ncbi:MAG: hypothetical protein DRO04_01415 [Candidatus Iainarchaeum archaeon]|uniref:Class III signal peptide-containing protein n=1 Tax=Candidatus Iainarchaeum sp. TaxID=3101447 RepID=A0A497JKS2_9ARCH|nr:MAG: hypothetical protein DRO04_01415 [Candidatus Diapherotrites archaeon]
MQSYAKGQISLDVLLAFIALMLFLQFLLAVASNITQTNEASYIISQLKNNAFIAKEAFNACKIAKFSNASISIVIPKVRGLNKEVKECTLRISQNEIFAHAKTDEKDLNFTLELPEFGGDISIECGEVLNVEC